LISLLFMAVDIEASQIICKTLRYSITLKYLISLFLLILVTVVKWYSVNYMERRYLCLRGGFIL
jgi:hypothetical protein